MEFRSWSTEEMNGAIRTLEEAITSGVSSASYPGGGQIQYTTQSNMRSTLRDLYVALDAREGRDRRVRRVMHSSPGKGL